LSANFGETLESEREREPERFSIPREIEREREFLSFALEMGLCCIKIVHAVPCQTETYTHKHNRKKVKLERERERGRK
jgi:hypothetical protein